ncbi:PucR family transcriptional regulator [Hazenella sp. IB182353]|uniref:PucR family transcriptional regulator n=1 Tax=Polycladospora coralii TaxID=2771432 RepID=UPI001747250F|nr:PucR family transcriptional regulator ligand-binding domain-containing protein [Polycladospora coralii]MBS7530533.1 PucR family transcriptional regulator [Polycladospora coralii]
MSMIEQVDTRFTVSDCLKRPLFEGARILAGHSGLQRQVRWVHVLEIMDGSSYVHGEELVLMTGVGVGERRQLSVSYIAQLVESNVSALCIEMVHHYVNLSDSVKSYADSCHFPIILFEKPVSFIDITQDIHTFLIHRHHDQLVALEKISSQFLNLTLQQRGLAKILTLLEHELQTTVWLKDYLQGTPLIHAKEPEKPEACNSYAITVLDVHVGDLFVMENDFFSEFHRLIIDRAITAIAQELLRRFSLEERRFRSSQKWMHDLATSKSGNLPREVEIKAQGDTPLFWCAFQSDTPHLYDLDTTSDSLFLSFFQKLKKLQFMLGQNGIQSWITTYRHQWMLLGIDLMNTPTSYMNRLEEVWTQMTKNHSTWQMGVSRTFTSLKDAHLYWKQAELALSIQAIPSHTIEGKQIQRKELIHYDQLGPWQLYGQVEPTILKQYYKDQLNPLLTYDQKHGTDLRHTLDLYLETEQNKQATAKKLFIHRQTLYYRLNKINRLLGTDWESANRLLALKQALSIFHFIQLRQGEDEQ